MKLSITNLKPENRHELQEAKQSLASLLNRVDEQVQLLKKESDLEASLEERRRELQDKIAWESKAAADAVAIDAQLERLRQELNSHAAALDPTLRLIERRVLAVWHEEIRRAVAESLVRQLEDVFEKLLSPFFREAITPRRIAGTSDSMEIVRCYFQRGVMHFDSAEKARAGIKLVIRDIDLILKGEPIIDTAAVWGPHSEMR